TLSPDTLSPTRFPWRLSHEGDGPVSAGAGHAAVSIPRQSRGLYDAGPSKGPGRTRDPSPDLVPRPPSPQGRGKKSACGRAQELQPSPRGEGGGHAPPGEGSLSTLGGNGFRWENGVREIGEGDWCQREICVRNHFIFDEKVIVFGYGQSAASGGWREDLSCAELRELPLAAVPRNFAL